MTDISQNMWHEYVDYLTETYTVRETKYPLKLEALIVCASSRTACEGTTNVCEPFHVKVYLNFLVS